MAADDDIRCHAHIHIGIYWEPTFITARIAIARATRAAAATPLAIVAAADLSADPSVAPILPFAAAAAAAALVAAGALSDSPATSFLGNPPTACLLCRLRCPTVAVEGAASSSAAVAPVAADAPVAVAAAGAMHLGAASIAAGGWCCC